MPRIPLYPELPLAAFLSPSLPFLSFLFLSPSPRMPGNASSAAGDRSTDSIPAAISAGERYKAMSPARLPIARSPCAAILSGFSPTAMIESPVLLTNIKASVASNSKQQELSGKNQSPFETQGSSPSQLVKTENIAQHSQELALSVNRSDSLVEVLAVKSVPSGDASNELQHTKDADSSAQAAQTYCNGSTLFSAVEKSAEDGYSWRKYGQKQVKGCEFPRSYYKCTHHNCQMKKLLERSHDGQITEIIYKGRHDHPMPQQTRRSAVTAIFTSQREEKEDRFSSLANSEENFSNAHGQASHLVCPNYNSELSAVSVNDDEVDVRSRQAGLGDEVAGAHDDLQLKRRKMDAAAVEVNSIAKNNREPRVVVQTISEVDILDDGYRWRKYGQKVVKGNPNPRSYYKCTNLGCSVRKHVERASHDPKAVITTYEGKHNHDVPTAKTSGNHEASAPMITDGKTAFGNHLPAALGSMLRTCNSHQYPQPEESNSISLHLGVGVSSNHSGTLNDKQHIPVSEQVQGCHQPQYVGSNNKKPLVQTNPMSKLYGISKNVAFGSREDREAFSFSTQINHSSSHYCPIAENLVMSP